MRVPENYTSIAWACRSLKATDPRLLLEIADNIRQTLNSASDLKPSTLFLSHHRPGEEGFKATYEDIAAYFEKATGRYVPVLFETPELVVESDRVRLSSDWIAALASHAQERLGLAVAIELAEANSVACVTQVSNSAHGQLIDQPQPMTASAQQALRQGLALVNDQRKAQEAAGREAIARQAAEAKVVELEAKLQAREAENRILREQLDQASEDKINYRRQVSNLEADVDYLSGQLDAASGLSAFMDPQNPLSPPIGRELVLFWTEVTANGTVDPTKVSGLGIGPRGKLWWKNRHGTLPSLNELQALKTACTPAIRKKGGAVSKG